MELKDFIKNNDKLLETIGVFGALTAFLAQLKGFEDLAVIPLIISFLLIMELMESFPDIDIPLKTSVKLAAFQFLMVGFFLSIGYYILERYVIEYYRLFSLFAFSGLYSFIAIKVAQRTKLIQQINLKVKSQFIKNLLLLWIITIIFLLIFASTNLFTSYLSKWFGLAG